MLGIDVSKHELTCSLLDPHSRRVLCRPVVPNTSEGLRQLSQQVPPDCPWVLEPTGRYSRLAVRFAQSEGRRVLQAPTRQASLYLRSLQTRAKCDRLDAEGLGLYALTHTLRPFPPPDVTGEQLQELLRARGGLTKAIALLKQQKQELPAAGEQLAGALLALEAQRQALDEKIAALAAEETAFPSVAALQEVPGIGPLTAVTVAACLARHQFQHADQFVAYIGLDVAVRQSGKRAGTLGLTRQGDAEIRRLLFLAALANLRCKSSPFKTQYEAHRAKGLATTAAACAVARKLAKVCWSLVKHQTNYEAKRVTQQPERPAAPPAEPAERASEEQKPGEPEPR